MKTRFPSLIGAVLASAALFACDVADESAAGDPESTALLALAGDPELNLDELDREASPADVCSPERVRDHALNRQAQRQGAGGEQMGPPPEGGRGQMGPGGEGEGRMGPGGQGQARGGQEPGAGDQGEGRMGPPAERGEREGRPHGPRGPRGGLLAIYDLDGDGVLSDEEKATLVDDLTAGCEARLQRALDEFDADGDGVLDEEERQAAHEAHQAEREAHRAQVEAELDLDGDGVVSQEEHEAAREARRAECDQDGDGQLSEEEREARRDGIREHIRNGDPPPAA